MAQIYVVEALDVSGIGNGVVLEDEVAFIDVAGKVVEDIGRWRGGAR